MEINVDRRGNLTVETQDRIEHLSTMIFLLEVLYPDKEKSTLSVTEREFLAHCVVLDLEGIRIGSSQAIQELGKRLGVSRSRVYDLRRFVKNKGWLKQDDLGYSYPSMLTRDSLTLEIRKRDENNGQDSSSGGGVLQ